jgi:hypothetical protein
MTAALKQSLVPELRRRGFRGSFPHFYRLVPGGAHYLMIQFYSSGGSFVVEIAKCGPNGLEGNRFGSELPLDKLNVPYFKERLRLGSDVAAGRSDHWFEFGPRSYDSPQVPRSLEFYDAVAQSVIPFLDRQGEAWWAAV